MHDSGIADRPMGSGYSQAFEVAGFELAPDDGGVGHQRKPQVVRNFATAPPLLDGLDLHPPAEGEALDERLGAEMIEHPSNIDNPSSQSTRKSFDSMSMAHDTVRRGGLILTKEDETAVRAAAQAAQARQITACAMRIMVARVIRGYESQGEFARALGVSHDLVHVYESGKRGFPPTHLILSIARVLGVSVEWLLTGNTAALSREVYRQLSEGGALG